MLIFSRLYLLKWNFDCRRTDNTLFNIIFHDDNDASIVDAEKHFVGSLFQCGVTVYC